ncbi:hypothetical protein [Sphaerimonospora thailandensis]|uniref:Uncharacterized protein n=1 Tax=Sphaerimonospora thailandensis TaxID=795644 RepID=A0A8J3RJN4_9ACTN|nr:hypothetical protein [Sphaerimonospora thailandensis]GIH73543.1 hypothetical protein Mth01_57960 [Sphaerimonospora thailandensis]
MNTHPTPSGGLFPMVGSPSVTATAMRAAADLLERAGVSGVSVTCDDARISIQVSGLGRLAAGAGPAAGIAALSALATVLGSRVLRRDTPARPCCWLEVNGTAAGVPVIAYAEVKVSIHGQGGALAMGPDGELACTIPAADPPPLLPPGWRWATELDHPGFAPRHETVEARQP